MKFNEYVENLKKVSLVEDNTQQIASIDKQIETIKKNIESLDKQKENLNKQIASLVTRKAALGGAVTKDVQ